jgi:uncharacterized protein
VGEHDVALEVVLKVASRCNLNCSYCYVYNKEDDSWRDRPGFMPDEVFAAAVHRIRRHCERSHQRSVTVIFHGGEPLLVGPWRMAAQCRALRAGLEDVVRVRLVVQTNGTLLDERWAEVLREHDVEVGVSVDGPPALHDVFRVDHRGRGSYARVERGLACLRDAGVRFSILSVVQFGADGLAVHDHLMGLQPAGVSYLLPDFTHDSIGPVRRRYGPTPCADFLLPIMDSWLAAGPEGVRVDIVWNVARLVLGGDSALDLMGNGPLRFVFVEADGAIEGLDVLRACGRGVAGTGLDVRTHDFVDIAAANELHRRAIFAGMPLPEGCRGCREEQTCAGGYLPHRWSAARGFDNPSVWCADLLALFDHLRERLHVPVAETTLRRQVLAELAAEGESGAEPVAATKAGQC